MSRPDFNQLVTLDVLLTEGSVARAARRLRLSPSAMSRALARLRETTGDPLLVRAGRQLVPTPRALELRERVHQLVNDGAAVLRPAERLDLVRLARTFTLRTSEGFVENFGPALVARVGVEAPGVRLWFIHKADKESSALRSGQVDLETGVVEEDTGPELRARVLFADRYVGVMRAEHPLARQAMTTKLYVAGRHVAVSRHGSLRGKVDDVMASLGLEREVVTIVDGFATALAIAGGSDLMATVPERHTGNLRSRLHTFELPFAAPPFSVSMLWHPRQHADQAHRWLRGMLVEVCAYSASLPGDTMVSR
jgi:DNA-binding transcriptional LysR family regulator